MKISFLLFSVFFLFAEISFGANSDKPSVKEELLLQFVDPGMHPDPESLGGCGCSLKEIYADTSFQAGPYLLRINNKVEELKVTSENTNPSDKRYLFSVTAENSKYELNNSCERKSHENKSCKKTDRNSCVDIFFVCDIDIKSKDGKKKKTLKQVKGKCYC